MNDKVREASYIYLSIHLFVIKNKKAEKREADTEECEKINGEHSSLYGNDKIFPFCVVVFAGK